MALPISLSWKEPDVYAKIFWKYYLFCSQKAVFPLSPCETTLAPQWILFLILERCFIIFGFISGVVIYRSASPFIVHVVVKHTERPCVAAQTEPGELRKRYGCSLTQRNLYEKPKERRKKVWPQTSGLFRIKLARVSYFFFRFCGGSSRRPGKHACKSVS